LIPTLALFGLLACGGAASCPEGEVLTDGECAPYTAGEPVEADVTPITPGVAWQWQLLGELDLSFDVAVFDLDLFDAPEDAITALQDRGVLVLCYFSAGSFEDWRDDAGDFPESSIGAPLDEWPGEWWVDHRDPTVREIMAARLDLAAARGCDGVEPDNVDGYANDNGLGLNATEQLAYNRFLADEAHARGLSVGLKNDLNQIGELLPWFDWALNEECAAYEECDLLAPFTEANKAVLHVEYVDDEADGEALADEVCGVGPNLDTLIKGWDLDAWRIACDER